LQVELERKFRSGPARSHQYVSGSSCCCPGPSVQADRVAGSLQPGDHSTRRNVDARFCIGGISKAFLIGNFGLTAEQADDFFKKPITVLWLAKTRRSETC